MMKYGTFSYFIAYLTSYLFEELGVSMFLYASLSLYEILEYLLRPDKWLTKFRDKKEDVLTTHMQLRPYQLSLDFISNSFIWVNFERRLDCPQIVSNII